MVVKKRRWYAGTVHQEEILRMIAVIDRYNVETTNTSTDTTDINRIYFEAKMTDEEAAVLKLSIGRLHLYPCDIECTDPF